MIKRPTPADIETELVIIGAGVAGLSLMEELEGKIDFWLLGSPFESQISKAGELFDTILPKGTVGLKHMEKLVEEMKNREINHRSSLSTGIDQLDDSFLIKTKFQNFNSKYIVIATGCKQKGLGFKGETEYFHNGISDCSVCDFPLYRDKKIAVIGNHEYTTRAAKFLKQYTPDVTLLWYRKNNAPSLSGIPSFNLVTNVEVSGSDLIEKIRFSHSKGEMEMNLQGLFVEGEPVPNTEFLNSLKITIEDGFVKIDENMNTSIPNIWAVGDVTGTTNNYNYAYQKGKDLAELILNHIK